VQSLPASGTEKEKIKAKSRLVHRHEVSTGDALLIVRIFIQQQMPSQEFSRCNLNIFLSQGSHNKKKRANEHFQEMETNRTNANGRIISM
jgi:hypothetical protein